MSYYRPSNTSSQRPSPLGPRTNTTSTGYSPTANMSSLFGGGNASAASSANPTQGDLSKDVEVKNPPEDSISQLSFSPVSDHLAVSSWDKKVRIYEIAANGDSQGRAMFEFEGPALGCTWSKVRHRDEYRRMTWY